MKKILFLLFAAIISVSAMAGSDLKVTDGNKKFFKSAKGTAVLVFDFNGATYDGKMPLEQHENFTDMKSVNNLAWNGFKENFEDENDGKINIVKSGNADYKITVKVTKMDQFLNVMGWVPAPATKVWGTVTVTETSTGYVVLEAKINGLDGGSNPKPEGTISDCFEELGEQVAKLK